MRALTAVMVAAAAFGLLPSCKQREAARPHVAVSIFPLYDISRRIAGDALDVVLILPPGRSEHGYEPTPKEMAKVADAKLAVLVGLGMDEWAKKIVRGAASGTAPKELELGPLVEPRTMTAPHVGEEEAEAAAAAAGGKHDDDEDEHKPGAKDPHFWLDPVRMQKAAAAITDAFAQLAPPAAQAAVRARGDDVKQKLAALHAELEGKQKTWAKRSIVTFHGSMGYFADRYGLTIAAIIEPFPGREPTAKYLSAVLAAIKSAKPAALFSEPQLDRAPAKVTADQAGLPLYELDPVGGTSGVESYEGLLRHDAEVLDKALK
jgi:ABC-type Zn uptake system ZnuABC Zn-binding protein ZnuA